MDEYKKIVIELVRNSPSLWDPSNKDYKNKEQRKLVWEEIEQIIQPPPGVTIGAKTTWDQLTRGFCNALKRKNRKSGRGSANKKEWKFQEDMMFLIPAKKSRAMPGYIDPGMESDESERSFHGTSVNCNVGDALERTVHFNKVTVIDGPVKKELNGQEEEAQMKLAVTKLLNLNSKRDKLIKHEDELIKCFQQHQEQKLLDISKSSPKTLQTGSTGCTIDLAAVDTLSPNNNGKWVILSMETETKEAQVLCSLTGHTPQCHLGLSFGPNLEIKFTIHGGNAQVSLLGHYGMGPMAAFGNSLLDELKKDFQAWLATKDVKDK
ncbi:uncharacterized protein LOC131946491 [Physella acuta]|uniref:uncharacterized protein LOC131946491 n=1 Tax=Physella acuta TaxID=109671 RepID=UPI0027DACCAD|nr:uncharacterized protein LOC131946491 [Physella acuta]